MSIPEAYKCSITHEMMNDPVVDNDGNSYERDAIEKWLHNHSTSPITRSLLSIQQLRPNRGLKSAIEEYKKQHIMDLCDPYEHAKQLISSTRTTTVKHVEKHTPNIERSIPEPVISVVPKNPLKNGHQWVDVHVKINVPSDIQRISTDIVIALDTSGSMGSNATTKTSSGQSSSTGLTLLDIAKYTIELVMEMMKPTDQLCLITFSSNAKTVCNFTYMDASGKQKMKNILKSIQEGGMTNFWDGVKTSLDAIQQRTNNTNSANVFVFTDGLPNMKPPAGYVGTLEQYKDQHDGFKCSLSTFGFGYQLDSELLTTYATIGNGDFSFIPDSSFSITTFVHKVCNVLNHYATDCMLSLETMHGSRLVIDTQKHTHKEIMESSWGAQLSIGDLHQGRSRDLVFTLELPASFVEGTPYLNVSLQYTNCFQRVQKTSCHQATSISSHPEARLHSCRLQLIDCVMDAYGKMKNGQIQEAQMLIESLTQFIHTECDAMGAFQEQGIGLLTDLSGQIREAFSREDWFKRWGKHYIHSLLFAHQLQQCNNFKDEGVQFYRNSLFLQLRDEADQLCSKLPPPKPSYSGYGSSSYAPMSVAQFNQTMNNCSNPCFHGDCWVRCIDNCKQVRHLQKGDKVLNHLGKYDTIECVLKTVSKNGFIMTQLADSQLKLTPMHPILVHTSGLPQWVHPYTIGNTIDDTSCDAVYSFLLKNRSSTMIINGVVCATLSHGIENNSIVSHHYYGTEHVANDLKRMCGFPSGLVVMQNHCIIKDEDDQVLGLDLQKEIVSSFDISQVSLL